MTQEKTETPNQPNVEVLSEPKREKRNRGHRFIDHCMDK